MMTVVIHGLDDDLDGALATLRNDWRNGLGRPEDPA
jgi:hypothetical protein